MEFRDTSLLSCSVKAEHPVITEMTVFTGSSACADDDKQERRGLRQLGVAFAKAFEAHREADAFFRRLEDDEGRGLAGTQLVDQGVVHDHFGNAAVGQAAHESSAPVV